MRRAVAALIGLLALAGTTSVSAQGPTARWQTLETKHFRVHFPREAEAWATRTASRLDAILDRVAAEVGHRPPTPIEVVVADPWAQANGNAYPILGMPRMVLWTTPPGPTSSIGHYRDWGHLLAIHETAHLAHLMRPSRNRWVRWSQLIVPAGPLARKVPRWMIEGYATWIEGALTSAGRPHGTWRAAVLRRWAQRGELPDYARLSADRRTWLGPSMAYLVGSAYLDWLVARSDPDSMRRLWARLSARVDRPFDSAFAGVFGDAPRRLYNRFRAELTHAALEAEASRQPMVHEGEPWLVASWTTGPPAVSPDGRHLVLVRRARDRPSRLEVFATADDPETASRREAAVAELLARDPDDVPPVSREPDTRAPVFVLPARDGAEPHSPRWLGDDRVLYVRFEPRDDGVFRPDLFRWSIADGQVERLTHGAGVRDPDPSPDGRWAVAVRHRWGATQLVRVTLVGPEVGAVSPLTEARVDVVYAQPRIAPDGKRVAYVVHRGVGWRLELLDLETGVVAPLPPTDAGDVADPAWGPSGARLYLAVGDDGYRELHAVDPVAGRSWPVVRNHGAARAAAPAPDGDLFFLALEPYGFGVRRLSNPGPLTPRRDPPAEGDSVAAALLAGRRLGSDGVPTTDRDVVAVRAESDAARSAPSDPDEDAAGSAANEGLAPGARFDAKPYGFGRGEWLPLVAGTWSPGGTFFEAGARVGDLLGRHELVALGTVGDSADGGVLTATYRGWPVTVTAGLSSLRLLPSGQPRTRPGLVDTLDVERAGLELLGRWRRPLSRTGWLDLTVGGFVGTIEQRAFDDDQGVAFVRARYERRHRRGGWRWRETLAVGADWGQTGNDHWRRDSWALGLGAAHDGWAFGLRWRRHRAHGTGLPVDRLQVGGLAPSRLPEAMVLGWIESAALPGGVLVGTRYEGQRVTVALPTTPLRAFAERHRLLDGDRSGWLRLVGLELSGRRAAWPLVRLPALSWTLGVAGILDPPFEDAIEGWISVRWRP